MRLKFIDPSSLDRNMKATVHKSGKLGFTRDAAEKLGLGESKSAKIAVNQDDPDDPDLYVLIVDSVAEGAFKINRAGKYFYINTKALFDTQGMDYVNNTYVYDITRATVDGTPLFKFRRRPPKASKNGAPSEK